MSSIPDELFHDILLRLPAKSLLVCKRVCKNWFELISNPSFVNAHANLITQRNNFSLTSKCYAVTGNEYVVHSIGYESLGGSEKDDHADDMLFKGGSISSSTPQTFIDLLCSCNGLVCLYFQNKRKICLCLWNPATKEYKKLPEAPASQTSLGSVDFYNCALGYDYKINDYKFVTFVRLDKFTFEILVYTLGSNSWKKIQNISSLFTIVRQCGVLVDGSFHWLGRGNADWSSTFIISFDISSERSNDIQLPKEALDEGWYTSVGVLEGRLCVVHVVSYFDHEEFAGRSLVILWVMQEYGDRASWSKRYVINHDRIQEHCYDFRLMWYFKNGEVLFSGHYKLFVYDPNQEILEYQILMVCP